jgi:hypothetical protein
MSFVSNSSSFIPDYSQSSILQQIAQIASQLGQQQYQWAQQQYAGTSALTDQAVQQYLASANASDQLAQNNISRYEGQFQPLEDQLVQDANSYNSPSRAAFEMGKAESGAGQAMDASRINAENQLKSFGIDPSSGRYAELEMAQNAQRGAAQAGAGLQAEQNTEATGRALRGQAIQVGQQYPGQAVNALNSEVQGLSGAVNSKLANLNAGTAAMGSAAPFLNTAMSLKYPPLGTNSHSQSGQGFKVGGGGSGGGPGSDLARFGVGNNSSPSGYPGYTGYQGGYNSSASVAGGAPDASITNLDPGAGGGFGDGSSFDTYGQQGGYGGYTNYDPNGYGQFADTSSQAMPGGGSAFDTYGQDVGAYTNYGGDTSGYNFGGDTSGGGLSYNSGGQDFGSNGDTSYSSDPTAGFSNYDSGGFSYAAGGEVPPTTGGMVPQQASPSGGALQDDVPANLNEGEFVVPRDVAMWKGQEFFQKLIDQSRKARMGASAQGKPGPRQPGPPRFASQAMG